MPNFVDCWQALKAKGYKHADGSEVLGENEKASLLSRIQEHQQAGLPPLEAERAAVRSHLQEASAHLQSVSDQVRLAQPSQEAAVGQRIVTTAVKEGDQIVRGQTPNESHDAIGERTGIGKPKEENRGFIVQDANGQERFTTDRTEAGNVARASGQVAEGHTGELHSEDLTKGGGIVEAKDEKVQEGAQGRVLEPSEITSRFRIVGSRGRGEGTPTSDYDVVTQLTPSEYKTLTETPEGEFPRVPEEVKNAAFAGHDVFIEHEGQAWKVEPNTNYPEHREVIVERVSQIEKQLLKGERKLAVAEQTSAPVATSTEPHVSGIANRISAEKVAKGEVGEIAPGQGKSVNDLRQVGLKMSPEEINQHVSDVMNGTGDLEKQGSALTAEEARLSQRSSQLSRESEADPTNMEKKLAADNAFKDLTDFHNGPIATLKTRWSNAGKTLQGEIPVDLSTFNGQREAWLKDMGKPPPPEVEPVLRESAKKVATANSEADAAMSQVGNLITKASSGRKLASYEQVRDNILQRLRERTPCN